MLPPGARKSVVPMAAHIEPGGVQARHKSLHYVVAKAEWEDRALPAAGCRLQAAGCCAGACIVSAIERHGSVRYWIVDAAGFPKQAVHSFGVTRQYGSKLGESNNCQVAVSLPVANDHASLPVA